MKAERRQQIRELLQRKPFISLKELTELFPDVTSMTLRRDIEYFEQEGELIKVRNGARSMKFIAATADEKYSRREKENEEIKRSLALSAVQYLEKGKCIFFDSGSTIMQLACVLPDERMTIVTPSPNISMKLIEKKNPIISLIGGILNRDSISVTGDMSIDALSTMNIDIAFLVPSGFSTETGFTCGNYSESELKNYVVKHAAKVIMILDSSKYEKKYPYKFCDLSDIDIVITDTEFPKYSKECEQLGVQVVSTGRPLIREHVSRCIPIEI